MMKTALDIASQTLGVNDRGKGILSAPDDQNKMVPGAIVRRDRGGGQSQAQGAQEVAARPRWKGRDFLSFQWRAGAETKSAEATAKVTKLHFNHGPGVISLVSPIKKNGRSGHILLPLHS